MSGMRGQNQPGRVVVRLIAGLDRANSPLVGQQPIAIQNRSGIRLGCSSGPPQNFNQVFSILAILLALQAFVTMALCFGRNELHWITWVRSVPRRWNMVRNHLNF